MLLLAVFLSSFFISPENNGTFYKKKCDLDYLVGEWYGEYTFYSGTTYLMYMDVEKADHCEVSGIMHWPDYFNTRTRFKGVVKNGVLQIKETKILQGMIMDLEESSYKIPIQPADSASGTAFQDKTDVAKFMIRKKATLADAELNKYKSLFQDYQQRYGKTEILKEAMIPFQDIVDNYKKNAGSSFLPFPLKIEGTALVGRVSLPIQLIFKPEENYYMEMSFQNTKFLFGSNGKKSWSYDPTSDKVVMNEVAERENSFGQFSNTFLSSIDKGFESIGVNEANVDSIASYRTVLKKDDELRVFYFSKENYQIIREETGYTVNHYLRYRQFDNTWIPTLFLEMNPGRETNKFSFESFTMDEDINDAIFELPEHLKYKIEEKEKNYSLYKQAEAEFEGEHYERAVELYTKAIKINSTDANIFYRRGIAKYFLEDNYGAISDFQRAIDLNPGVADYYNRRGLVKYRLGDYGNAKKDFAKSIQIDSTVAVVHMNKAYAAYYLDQKDSALISIDHALRYDSTNASYYANKGGVLIEVENYNDGLISYKKALALGHDDQGALLNRIGVAHFKLSQYDTAIYYFSKSLESKSDDFQRQKNLAEAYYYNEQYDKAIPEFERALGLNENDGDIHNELGLCHYYLEEYKRAIYQFDKAIALNNKNATYYDNRAYSYASIARYQEAISDFSTSISLYADDPEVYYQRALLNQIQNNRFESCRDFKKASEMGHKEALNELKENCDL